MPPRSRRPPSGSRRRRRRRCCSRRSRSPAGCSGRRATSRRWPCRRWSRCPARAGRWSSPRPTPVVLGMPGRLAAELAEAADVVERDRRLAQPLVVGVHGPRPGQVQHRPEQHRGVAVREHEAIAVGPDRILRVEAHHAVPERVDQRRERHRRAGVPGLGRLHRIHRERADGVDRRADPAARR